MFMVWILARGVLPVVATGSRPGTTTLLADARHLLRYAATCRTTRSARLPLLPGVEHSIATCLRLLHYYSCYRACRFARVRRIGLDLPLYSRRRGSAPRRRKRWHVRCWYSRALRAFCNTALLFTPYQQRSVSGWTAAVPEIHYYRSPFCCWTAGPGVPAVLVFPSGLPLLACTCAYSMRRCRFTTTVATCRHCRDITPYHFV